MAGPLAAGVIFRMLCFYHDLIARHGILGSGCDRAEESVKHRNPKLSPSNLGSRFVQIRTAKLNHFQGNSLVDNLVYLPHTRPVSIAACGRAAATVAVGNRVVKMAPLPPLTPTPPESPGARVSARIRSEVSDDTIRQADAGLIFVKLRKMIASDTQPADTILGTIAVAAHSLTGASGAAIAMPRDGDGEVVCVGRSGETAPELGDPLDVDSGISGECLRTGMILRCDDATRDFHVDAEVCRQLGLQSIAVVPLRGQYGRVGVLEAFSTEAYAFTEDKMDLLGRLAGLAEAAWARGAVTEGPEVREDEGPVAGPAIAPETPTEVPAEASTCASTRASNYASTYAEAPLDEPPLAPTPVSPDLVPLARVREVFAAVQQPRPDRRLRYLAMAGATVLILVLLSVYGWRAWYKASLVSGTSHPAVIPQVAPGQTENVAAGAALKPGVQRPVSQRTEASLRKFAAAAAIPDTVTRRQQSSQPNVPIPANAEPASDSSPGVDEVPQIAASGDSPADLGEALSSAPALPKLSVPISQGVAGGALVQKVQPAYPAEARRLHLEGTVVLEATVTVQGEIENLTLISGHPILAQAATDAVRKWRYTPYVLNGKPVPKQTRISITFIAPQ